MAVIDEIIGLLKVRLFEPQAAERLVSAFRKVLAASGALTVKESTATVSAAVTSIDFGAGFDVTELPAGEANVTLDMAEAPYDNGASGLAATDIQSAIDEIAAASGGGNSVTVTVNFGATFTHFAQTVVTGQAWVEAGSEVTATPLASAGAAEETALMAFSTVVSDLVVGDGFTLSVYTPTEAKGNYTFSCIGV